MLRLLLPVAVALLMILAGCTSISAPGAVPTSTVLPSPSPSPTVVITSPPQTPVILESTVQPAAAPLPVEDSAEIESRLTVAWREIRMEMDAYYERLDKVSLTGDSQSDLNYVRETVIPGTIARLQTIRANVTNISSVNPRLQNETEGLASICSYRILGLQGYSSYYQAIQMESYDLKKSRAEYKEAKYIFQDAVDIINEAPDVKKFNDYILLDKSDYLTRINGITFRLDQLNII